MTGEPHRRAELTLGPILFNWPADRKRDFYFRIADETAVDTVYVGEVVCSKRQPFFDPHLPAVIDRLSGAGKAVVHSTLALVMSDREVEALRALARDVGDVPIEANDAAAIRLLAGRPHVVGPFVGVYNEAALGYLAANGATRVVLPCELSGQALARLAQSAGAVGLEVQVFGRLPLAVSARCYHARSRGLAKDACQFVCAEDADGLGVDTLDGKPFLAVNGTQTLSAALCNLAAELEPMRRMGIDAFRLWPHAVDMGRVATLFRDLLDGRTDAQAATAGLAEIAPFAPFANGYYYGREGAVRVAPAAADG